MSMSFGCVIGHLQDGNRIRREDWPRTEFWVLDGDGMICDNDGDEVDVDQTEIFADDWVSIPRPGEGTPEHDEVEQLTLSLKIKVLNSLYQQVHDGEFGPSDNIRILHTLTELGDS